MKFVLILILLSSNGTASIATAEFDDLDACENAGTLTVPQLPNRAVLNRHCVPKSSAPAKPTAKK